MSDWRPHRDPKPVGSFEVQYMTSSAHAHEGAHRIDVDGVSVLVLPDGRTTARNRSAVITRLLEAIPVTRLEEVSAEERTYTPIALWALIGGLLVEGVTSIEVEGRSILPEASDRIASIRLDVRQGDAGLEISLTDLGGSGAQA